MKTLLIAISILLLSGCATIDNGGTQDIMIRTTNNRDFRGTLCNLKNEEGQWQARPASLITIHRDNNDLDIACENELQKGSISIPSVFRISSLIFDSILLCVVCIIVDSSTNSFYEYIENIEIPMIDRDNTLIRDTD